MNKFLPMLFLATAPLLAQAQDSSAPVACRESVPVTFKQPLDPSWWAQISLGYNNAFFNDFNQGCMNAANYAQALNSLHPGTANESSVQTGNSGSQEALELGFQLDKKSALYLKAENDWSQSMGWSRTQNGVLVDSFKVNPLLWGVSVNFEQDLLCFKWAKTFFTVGGGWYFADFNATLYDANQIAMASFTGNVFGGTLGLGQAIQLGGTFDLEFSIEGRCITFNSLTSATPPGPNFVPGPYFLSVIKNENFGSGLSSNTDYLAWSPQKFLSSRPDLFRFAVADYSGISGVFSLRYSF